MDRLSGDSTVLMCEDIVGMQIWLLGDLSPVINTLLQNVTF